MQRNFSIIHVNFRAFVVVQIKILNQFPMKLKVDQSRSGRCDLKIIVHKRVREKNTNFKNNIDAI